MNNYEFITIWTTLSESSSCMTIHGTISTGLPIPSIGTSFSSLTNLRCDSRTLVSRIIYKPSLKQKHNSWVRLQAECNDHDYCQGLNQGLVKPRTSLAKNWGLWYEGIWKSVRVQSHTFGQNHTILQFWAEIALLCTFWQKSHFLKQNHTFFRTFPDALYDWPKILLADYHVQPQSGP